MGSHGWLRQGHLRTQRRGRGGGGRGCPMEEGCEVMLEAEVAAVALEEEVKLAVYAETEGDTLT